MGHRSLVSGRNRSTVTIVYYNIKSLFSTANNSDGNVAAFRKDLNVCNGGKEGERGNTCKWIPSWEEAKLAAKGSSTLDSTFSSERAVRYGGKKAEIEKLWQELFSNPIEWRDHRFAKVSSRSPDFTHEKTNKALWLDSRWIPPWVENHLAMVPQGTIQLTPFSWNERLLRYAQAGQYEKTMELFQEMQRCNMTADKFTFFPVLKACASLGLLEQGRRIHMMMQPGLEADSFTGSTLVDMYAKCGSIKEAERVFKLMPTRDVVVWNAMIFGYVKCREGQKALDIFQQMQWEGIDPNPVTFVGVLNACACLGALEAGRRTHKEIIHKGYELDIVLRNSLVDMFAKCGSIEEAERVFKEMPTKDVVAWNAMIFGYVKCQEGQKALQLFERMQWQGVDPDGLTFVAVLNACASTAALETGRCIHEEVIRRGYELDTIVGNSLVDMYAKCGSIEEAERVFKEMPTRDVVAWNAMIFGYVKCQEGQKALELSQQMQLQAVDQNHVTFVGILNACASITALEVGRRTHEEIICRGYESEIVVGTSLVGMYTKCGSIEEAERVFNQMPRRDVVAWTAMLKGYSRHGYARKALETFKQMCKTVEVDGVTFNCLLSACSHGGFIHEGLEYFKSMSAVYRITPTVEHYACIVDLLGRAGHLCEAESLIIGMPMDPNVSVWMSLLGACRGHGNVELGKRCAKRVLELDPDNAEVYVQLSDIYVAAGQWESSARVHQEF